MHRYFSASVTALALGISAATAADLSPVYTKAPPAPVPYSWTGFYAGVNAGYTWMDPSVDSVGSPVFANPLALSGTDPTLAASVAGVTTHIPLSNGNGFIGGGQIGYYYQIGNVVPGIEADFQGLSGKASGSISTSVPIAGFPGNTANTTLSAKDSVSWLGTLRGQLGFTVTPTVLLYGTGGLAYGETKSETDIGQQLVGPAAVTVNSPYGSSASFSDVRIGWAAGAGGAWMMAPNWIIKLEYLHYDLGSVSYGNSLTNIVAPPGGAVPTGAPFYTLGATSSTHFDGNIVRVGVSYKFTQ